MKRLVSAHGISPIVLANVSGHGFSRAAIAAKMKGALAPALIALALLLFSAPAFAQGCAMCYSNAAGSTKDGQKAISKGVLVLLVPPLGFMTVGMGLAFRYSRKRDKDAEIHLDEDGEL